MSFSNIATVLYNLEKIGNNITEERIEVFKHFLMTLNTTVL